MATRTPLASDEQALLIAQALLTLAEGQGLQITITLPEKPDTDPHPPVEEAIPTNKRQREDLAWLETYLTQHPDEFFRLKGKYVAVYRRRIVSIGEDKKLVILGASENLKVTAEDILILPVCVEGPDADDEWAEAKAKLGIT